MAAEYLVYGAPGSGSVAVEAALTLAGAPFRVEDVLSDEALAATPLRQVPALRLPDGQLMTESAAILLHLAEAHRAARLAPVPGEPGRPAFLRWMSFVSAAIYALYWVRDEPSRVVDGEVAQAEVQRRIEERFTHCWSVMNRSVAPSPWLGGEHISVLDVYVGVVSRWEPGRRRFYETAPRLAEVVRLVDAEPRLQALWSKRFPFKPGWED